MNKGRGAMHGKGLPVCSPSVFVPTYPTMSPGITKCQLASARSWKVLPTILGGGLWALCRQRRCPELRTLEPSMESHPWELPGKGPGWAGGKGCRTGQAEEGDAAGWPGRCGASPGSGPGRQDWLWRYPLLQAKLKTARQACVSLQLSSDPSFRTDWRCWGRTAATARWKGHSWHL